MLNAHFRAREDGQVVLGNFVFPREFECKCGCGKGDLDYIVWLVCQLARQRFNAPVIIRSGCRCDQHNFDVSGADNSDHKYGWAADISVQGVSSIEVAKFLEILPDVKRIGIYEPGGQNGEDGFVHSGVRDRGPGKWKRWRYDNQRNLVSAA